MYVKIYQVSYQVSSYPVPILFFGMVKHGEHHLVDCLLLEFHQVAAKAPTKWKVLKCSNKCYSICHVAPNVNGKLHPVRRWCNSSSDWDSGGPGRWRYLVDFGSGGRRTSFWPTLVGF